MASKAVALTCSAFVAVAFASSWSFGAQSCVGFAGIVAGATSQYDSYQIKFTWVGEQTKTKKTCGVAGSLTTFSAASFQPCLLPASRYANDQAGPETITLSGSEIERFINKLNARPELQVPSVTEGGVLSWQIRRPVGSDSQVFEHVSNEVGARTVLLLLLESLDPGSTVEEETIIRVKRVFVGDL